MQVFDRFKVSDFSLTEEGYLSVPSRISRTGVQGYYGWEFGIEPMDKLFKWHRPADEVFAPDALRSFMLKPVTVGHPPGGVSASTWKDLAVGSVGLPTQDGDHVRADLLITAPDAINQIQRGTVELSCGYDCELDFTPGVTDDGQPYDGVMRKIRGNHVAIVPEGRCGPSCKIGDAATGGPKVVMLYASPTTNRLMREWAINAGFDLTKSYGGRDLAPEEFDFHLTLFATEAPITLPTGSHEIPAVTLSVPTGFAMLGKDANIPALSFGIDAALERMRGHYVQTYKARPTFPDFKPHISVSYAWAGLPDLASVALPSFPIILDRIVVDDLAPKIGDAAMPAVQDCGGNPACKCSKGDPTMKHSVTIDGATFEVADQKLADAIRASNEATSRMLADVRALLNDANASLADMKAKEEAADKAAAEAAARAEAAEKAKPTDADIAKMAADRAAVIVDAKKIAADFEPGDKSVPDIKAGVVAAKMGDEAVKDRSADYIAALFDTLKSTASDAGSDPIRGALAGKAAAVSPYAAYRASLSDAWKAKA